MKIVSELKGGSLSCTKIIERNGKSYVRKSVSTELNREYGLVRWQSQIRKQQILERILGDSVATICEVGVDGDAFYFDMPFMCGGVNCVAALESGVSVQLLADRLVNLLDKLSQFKFKATKGSMSVFIAEEVRGPLQKARLMLDGCTILSEHEKQVLERKIIEVEKTAQKYIKTYSEVVVQESLSHGNMTLENLLWDHESGNLVIIDPYAETYCDNINGDYSQLLQSAESGYEFVGKLYENNEYFDLFKYPNEKIPAFFKVMSEELKSRAQKCDWYDEQLSHIFHAAQFIRMFPFKANHNLRHAYGFLGHGMDIIKRGE